MSFSGFNCRQGMRGKDAGKNRTAATGEKTTAPATGKNTSASLTGENTSAPLAEEKTIKPATGKNTFALVTGASAGIGMEIAGYLAFLGYDLILTARSEDRLKKVRRRILRAHPDREVLVITADLTRKEECFRLHREVCEKVGREKIGFVANNAGMGVYGRFLETDLERELDLISLNVTSVHILSKLFLKDMVRNGGGVLLNVGSCAGFTSGPTFSSYYASKNYVVRLTEAIHEELRRARIPVRVSCLCPGPVDTAFNDNAGVRVSGKQITARQAAVEGVDGALKGKMLVIPGRKMKLVTIGSHLLGEHLSTRLNYLIQVKKEGDKASEH